MITQERLVFNKGAFLGVTHRWPSEYLLFLVHETLVHTSWPLIFLHNLVNICNRPHAQHFSLHIREREKENKLY